LANLNKETNEVEVNVKEPPKITAQPLNFSVSDKANVLLSVSAEKGLATSGTASAGSLGYQWRKSTYSTVWAGI